MEFRAYFLIMCIAYLGYSATVNANLFTHNLMEFGAVGDGKTDDSNALLSAWKAACGGSGHLTIPAGKTFLVSQTIFEGPCTHPSVTVEVFGKIVAPPRSAWENKGAKQWLLFHRVDGLTLIGNGIGLIDGRGQSWWGNGDANSRPTALGFSYCNNLHVTGLKHINSQRNHVSIDACNGATVSKLHMIAPQDSPNTDGIDISVSTNLNIHDSVIATGDDCIAINGGTSNVKISKIACGPGHGISIGSLGRNGNHDEVQNILVNSCTFQRTQNGVRIKTWQGGSGFVKNVTFSNIQFIEADNPVIIDQYYCPHQQCGHKESAIKISDVKYTGLRGTSICKKPTVNLSCSQSVPCTNIVLDTIDIKPASPNYAESALCTNAHGIARGVVQPTVDCLKQ